MTDYGALSLLPTLLVVSLALWTHRTIESLIAGSILGAVMLAPSDPLGRLTDGSLAVMMNDTVAWIILVCGFMGSLIALFIRTDAIGAFTRAVTARVNSRRQALMTTWVLGIFLFVDDYLNSIAVGAAMRKVSDVYHTSREMLAYIVDSTAAPISVIIPISTWAVFFAALMEDTGLVPSGEGVAAYIGAIPYMFYAWAAILLVPLVIYGKVPLLGPMRAAEARAAGGECVPPDAAEVDAANEAIQPKPGVEGQAWHFAGLMILLAASTWYFDLDFLRGIYVTLGAYVVMIAINRSLSLPDAFDTILDGFKTMLQPLAVLVAAYLLKEMNDELGLSSYVINTLAPYLSAATLPAALFISMAGLSFATGSNWGVFVIVMPVIVALSESLGADLNLVIGATLSAATFGSHACFYTDATVLTAQATGCTPYQHALTQIPYALIAAVIAVLLFLGLAA